MTTEKTMFNDEQKWRYILKKESEVTLAPGFLQNLFVKAAPFEEMYDKDLCEWTLNRNQNDENDLKNKAQVLLRRYVKCVDYLGLSKQMTTKRLAMSGKIDYIKRIMEREGLPLEETLRKHREEIDYIYPVERLKSIPLFVKKYGKIMAKQLRNQNL